MSSICPEDSELERLKGLVLEVLSYERDLYRPGWISNTAGEMAMNAIKLRSTIHELNCCRDTGLKHNNDLKEMNELFDEAIGSHETVKTIVPDGYLIDKNNNVLTVLEVSTRTEPSDQTKKVQLDRLKYDGFENLLRPLGWTLNVITISEKKPRIGRIPEILMFKLLSTSLSILSYTTDICNWISEEDYLELKKSLTSYDFRTLTEEFKGQRLLFDIESAEDPYKDLFDWMLKNSEKLPFSLNWEGPKITEMIQDFKREDKQLRLLEIMRSAVTGLNFRTNHLSLLNKLKSLNLLNTRRKQNKVYDYIALMLFVRDSEIHDFPKGWFPSVNDRLVRVDSVDSPLSVYKKLVERMIKSLQSLQNEVGSKQKLGELKILIKFLEESSNNFIEPPVLKTMYFGLPARVLVPQPSLCLKIINDVP